MFQTNSLFFLLIAQDGTV